MKTKLSR